jgi:hypothetical protein
MKTFDIDLAMKISRSDWSIKRYHFLCLAWFMLDFYLVSKIVIKKNFEAKGEEFVKLMRRVEGFIEALIYSNSKFSEQFLKPNSFSTY